MKKNKIELCLILLTVFSIIIGMYSCDNRELANPVISYKLQFNNSTSGGLLNTEYSTQLAVVQTDSNLKSSDTYTLTATISKGSVKNLEINSTPYQSGMTVQKLNQITFTPTSSGATQIIFDVTNNHGVSHFDTLNITVQEFSVQFSVSDTGVVDTAYKSIATKFKFNIAVNTAQAGADTAKFTFSASFLQGSGTLKVNNVSYAIGQPISQGSSTITLTPLATGTVQLLLKAYNTAGVSESDTVTIPVAGYVNVPYSVSAVIGTMYWPGTSTTTTVIDATDTLPVSLTLTSNSPSMTYQITSATGDGVLKTTSLQSISFPTAINEGTSNFNLLLNKEPLGSHSYTFNISDANGVSHSASITYTVTNVSFTLNSAIGSMTWPGTSVAKSVIRPNDIIPFSISLSSSDPTMTYSITALSGDGQLKDANSNNINVPVSIAQGTTYFNLQIYNESTGIHSATFTIADANGYSKTVSISYTVSNNISPTVSSGQLIHNVGTFIGFNKPATSSQICSQGNVYSITSTADYNALLNLNSNASDADGYIASYSITGYSSRWNANFSFTNIPINQAIANSGSNNNPPKTTCGSCLYNLEFLQQNNTWSDVQPCDYWLTIHPGDNCTLTIYDNEGAASGSITITTDNEGNFNTYASNPSNF